MFECLLCLICRDALCTKINRICKRECSGVFKETSLVLDPRTSTSNILNRHGKYLQPVRSKYGKKNKNKNNRCCKALCVNMQAQKFAKIFKNCFTAMTFIQPEHFLNQFYGLLKLHLIPCDLLEVLEATIPERYIRILTKFSKAIGKEVLIFVKLLGFNLLARTQFLFFMDFAFFLRNVYFKEILWIAAPT